MKTVYLLLCVLGTVLPYSQFGPWLLVHGLDIPRFFAELFSTRVGGFFGLDVLVSALVVWVFVFTEGTHLGMRRLWAPVIATLLVGCKIFSNLNNHTTSPTRPCQKERDELGMLYYKT